MKLFAAASIFCLASALCAQTVVDPDLRVQTYVKGLSSPTGVAFLPNSSEMFVTQKNDGRVLFLRDRRILGIALDLPVANDSEQGLLSIALSPGFATNRFVYLYHTVASADGGAPIANRVTRYFFDGSKLVSGHTILDLPPGPGPNHDGGKIMFDSKGKLFAVIGDLNRNERTANNETSSTLTRTAAIIRVQSNGGVITTNPFNNGGARDPIDDIFAYGIRNSFGIAFDPVNGQLWNTENGPNQFDEINRVAAGFNSGWRDIMGPTSRNGGTTGTLESLGPKAAYSDPDFSWATPVAPTDLHFLDSSRLGSGYRNDLFVGNVNTGALFHFDLTGDRSALVLSGDLSDRVADNTSGNRLAEQADIVFGGGFGIVSDIFTGPGGMFVLSLSNNRLYRISLNPTAGAASISQLNAAARAVPEPSTGAMLLIAFGGVFLRRRRVATS